MDELLEILNELKPGVDWENEEDFVKKGLLTSMEIVRLVVEINDNFDVELTPIDVIPENFYSVKTIYELIKRLEEE